MIASSRASSSSNEVSIRHASCGIRSRSSRQTGIPSPGGETYVEYGDVRAERGAAGEGVFGGVGVADDGDVRFGVE
ncbi:hypothetical protein SAMN02787118_12724 [Streptomyces mirabilis]|uniref:Uncharacterized protein n=1 Tax=Streptomyces mirabilis TaxID=68239 RepID=A0A1I2UBS1_9ACTN|nr:hypothetical protein SAMN02787118_12724 [Streptomyces mirabilis]